MNKRICFLLVLLLILANSAFVSAEESLVLQNTNQADALNRLGLFAGTDEGYELEKNLTRAEAITMVVRFIGMEEHASNNTYISPFEDVADWTKPYVSYAYQIGITSGISDTEFGSKLSVSQNQFLTMILRNLGYSDADGDFDWQNPYKLAYDIGLIKSEEQIDDFNRNDMVDVCCNALFVKYKDSDKTMYVDLIEKNVISLLEVTEVSKTLGISIENPDIDDSLSVDNSQSSGSNASSGNNKNNDSEIESPKVEKYIVTFLDEDNNVIDQAEVEKGSSVDIPDFEVADDSIFLGWDGQLYDIDSDITVAPIVVADDSKNIFAIDVVDYGNGKITATVKLIGDVMVSGFDMKLEYNDKLILTSMDANKGFNIISESNISEGYIGFNSASISNTKKDSEVISLEFTYDGKSGDVMDIKLTANDVIAIDIEDDYEVVNVEFSISRFSDNIE